MRPTVLAVAKEHVQENVKAVAQKMVVKEHAAVLAIKVVLIQLNNIKQSEYSQINPIEPMRPMEYNRARQIMENINKEIQTRREFFKSAAKRSLPIMGAIVLSATPFRLSAVQSSTCTDKTCTNTCEGSCTKWCNGTCLTSCTDNCKGSSGK